MKIAFYAPAITVKRAGKSVQITVARAPCFVYVFLSLLFIQLRTAALRLIVRSWLDVLTFATRRLHACHHATALIG